LHWERDELTAVDHPDPDGEWLLGSLGAPTAQCLRLVRLWTDHLYDVRALTLGSRGRGDQPVVDTTKIADITPSFRPPPTRRGPAGLAGLLPSYRNLDIQAGWQSWVELLELLNLPAPLQVRWGAGVAAHLLERMPSSPPPSPARPAPDLHANPDVMTTRDLERVAHPVTLAILDSALVARARHTLASLVGPHTILDIQVLPPAGMPTLRLAASDARLALHHDWITQVWGRDLAVIGNAFVLDAITHDQQTITLITETGTTTIRVDELEAARPRR
jgi:hypothetical protein